ncbi:hypothetical protein HDU87_005535 [Geranomyces variabilis]|uniref:Uncharacterized protein n=1 Tax=Geranomyces variabilis TaxID=109894 RepID=A0AAD5TGL4_9FUNG|nr:hypothetical protein HDU87_005535 [Geranomyces variabilis]
MPSSQTNWIFRADFQITPYEADDAGNTNCSLEFFKSSPVLEIVTSHPEVDQGRHIVTGKLDFTRWFTFTISGEGVVTAFYTAPDEGDEVIMIKKGVANQFSARIVEPGIGLRKRAFDTEEHDVGGPHQATYMVLRSDDDPHQVTFVKRSEPVRRDDTEPNSLTRSDEKVLIKNEHIGHIVSISNNDAFAVSASSHALNVGTKE